MGLFRSRPHLSPEVSAIISALDGRPAEWSDAPREYLDRAIEGPCGIRIEFCYDGCILEVKVNGDRLILEEQERKPLREAFRRWEAWEAAPRIARWKSEDAERKERIRAALLFNDCGVR